MYIFGLNKSNKDLETTNVQVNLVGQ